jgi:hypothetical protein
MGNGILLERKAKIKLFNQALQDGILLFKWEVGFNDGVPIANNISLYCNKHQRPNKMITEGSSELYVCDECPRNGYVNSGAQEDLSGIINGIQSQLQLRWEKLLAE